MRSSSTLSSDWCVEEDSLTASGIGRSCVVVMPGSSNSAASSIASVSIKGFFLGEPASETSSLTEGVSFVGLPEPESALAGGFSIESSAWVVSCSVFSTNTLMALRDCLASCWNSAASARKSSMVSLPGITSFAIVSLSNEIFWSLS